MTFPKPLKFEKKSPDNESIFLDHYDWLLDWARQHTQGASSEADDLVQDLYVRFVQMKTRPSFKDEDEIRAYLYTSLRNLFISKKLRSGRDAVSGLLAVDFDSVAYAMAGVDRSQLLHVRSDLAGICEYACARRKSSRAGSVLILRYFLGYLSTEVMALLRIKRSHVDTLVETARLEAKAYLTRPGVLRFLNRSEAKASPFPRYLPEEPAALFTELQRRIFSEPEGTCVPLEELRDLLLDPAARSLTTMEAAHLASCRNCLSAATKILNFSDLALRSFNGDDPSEGSGPQAPEAGGLSLKKLRRKLRETYEHRPKKLQIVVDGEVRGVQTITAITSNLQIALPPLSQPGFLEVLSEQGLGLLYFDLQQENVEIPGAQSVEVELSDSRQLSISVTLAGGAPLIELSYYDPLFDAHVDVSHSVATEDAVTLPTASHQEERTPLAPAGRLAGFLLAIKSRSPWLIGALAGLGFLSVHTLSRRPAPPAVPALASPEQVLSQAKHKDAAIIPSHGAIRQVFALEIRSKEGATLSSSIVASLRSADRPLRSLSLKTGDRIRATHWVNREGKTHDFVPRSPLNRKQVEPLGEAWQHPPDAEDFEGLAGSTPLKLRPLEAGYEVSFSRSPTETTPVVEGRLLVSRATLLPYAETLLVQIGHQAREYRFEQTAYEVLSQEQVSANDFVPDFGLRERSDLIERGDVNMAHLTLAALQTLEQQTQEVRTSIDIERDKDGGIDVTGVLRSKSEVLSVGDSLRSLEGGQELHIRLHSMDEARQVASSHTSILEPTLLAMQGKVSLDPMLRALLSARVDGSETDLDERVQIAAQDLLERGARIHRAAWTVHQIATRDFSSDEIKTMNDHDRKVWLALLTESLKDCDADLRATSAVLVSGTPNTLSVPTSPLSSIHDLQVAADLLRQHAERLEELLTRGLAISTEDAKPEISPPELLDELAEAQHAERQLTITVQRLQQATR